MDNNAQAYLVRIKDFLKTSEMTKPRLAVELANAKQRVDWRSTDYRFWSTFCREEVPLTLATIYNYVNTGLLIEKHGYPITQVMQIIDVIGWARFCAGIVLLESYIPVVEFIERFKDINLNQKVKMGETESDLVTFSFNIPAESAELLTNELIARGMRTTGCSRVNASAALCKLVKEVSENSW